MQVPIAETATSTDFWLRELSAKAHHEAVAATVPQMARQLQDALGQRIVASMLGIGDPKAVGRWARGERRPQSDTEQLLRAAYQTFRLIALSDSVETASAWFIGMNPHLRDRAPFAVLGEEPERRSQVLAAARAFVADN